jgi:hypothetical protein
MKLTKAHLFVVLLLALVFCSFFGGTCGGSALEGFNMPSDSTPYSGTGQYSDKYSSYGKLYRANDKYSKKQDSAYDRKDKVAAPDYNPDYTPSNPGSKSYTDDDTYTGSYAPYRKGHHSRSQGIPASQIPAGQEDLYMLKSEIVPPVCPACPAIKCDGSNGSNGGKTPPPCPPCARCPEPAFDCKKVPNYSSGNDDVLPRPVLNSFSQFGM